MAVYLVSLARLAGARPRKSVVPVTQEVRQETGPAAITDSAVESAETTGGISPPARKRIRKSLDSAGVTRKPVRKTRMPKRTTTRAKIRTATPASTGEAKAHPVVPNDALATSVEELLRLPREKVLELLSACDDPTRKVMLALIYRLATVEDELRSVSARVRSAGALALQSATTRTSPVLADADNDKTGLLEQVFQKNISLRRQS